jgi:predicted anti-sigma-YlaC factor YlaD
MTDPRDLDEVLRADHGDSGCAATAKVLGAYVELELAGEDAARAYPGAAIHLRSCSACRTDHDGVLEASRRLGDATSE